MRPTRILAAAALFVLPVVAAAQASDTLQLGERVRVRVASTRGNTNLFTGNIASISPDTLVLSIPGGKGAVILPRASINEVAKADGRESRWRSVPTVLPVAATSVIAGKAIVSPRSSGQLRALGVAMLALNVSRVAWWMGRTPPERWRPVDSWLNR